MEDAPAPVDALLAQLGRERDETAARVRDLEQLEERIIDASRDDNADDEHDPEGQTIAWDRAQTAALAASTRDHLVAVDAALERLRTGWDGRCADCGDVIPQARLLARPTATRCVRCAAARERMAR